MGKRKDGDDESRSSDQPPIKRSRRGAIHGNINQQLRVCQDILETLRNHRTDDGRLLSENFVRAPSRRISPEYHKLVSNPIDFMRIQQKLKTEEYESVEQFVTDIKNLTENAKLFHKKGSAEYKDAVELWQVFLDLKMRLIDIGDEISEASGRSRDSSPAQSTRSLRSNSPGRSTRSKDTSPGRFSVSGSDALDKCYLEEYLAGILQLADEDGRIISSAFRQLPAEQEYPDYYNVITNPIDLKTIASKLRKNQYRNLNDVQRDLNLMCRNAKTFNEPKSTIYKDANFLRKAMDAKKAEVLEMATKPLDKARSLHAAAVVDELLQSPPDEQMQLEEIMDDHKEDSDEEEVKNPSAQADQFLRVYWAVRDWKESDQRILSEPFCRLPSKKIYPDYYDEIKNPVSLFVINRKIKNGEYERFVELIDDLNLMFNNAKLYNMESSPIFNAACQLQAVTNRLALQVDPTIDVSQYTVEIPPEEVDESDESTEAPSSSKTGRKAIAKSRLARRAVEEAAQYRDKLLTAYNAIVSFKDKDGRWASEAFMEKPPRKLYPDYYQVIPDPIDLKTIKANIDADRYDSMSSLVADVELLFSNARHYNEENSQIYNDSDVLETLFKRTVEKLTDGGGESVKLAKGKPGKSTKPKSSQSGTIGRPKSSGSASTVEFEAGVSSKTPKQRSSLDIIRRRKMWSLYEAINNYTDAKGNKLSPIFSKLPSKVDYPDYYDIIKKPIDLQKIYNRLTAKSYDSLDSLVQDFTLMFDNACKYNDPESTIYKSSLTLQRVLLQKKAELQDEEMDGKVPDVQTVVQELLTNIFIAVYNHEDEEGRCLSDSLAELPDLIKDLAPDAPVVSLDDIKHKLDKGRYRRLDRFQDDIFEVFNKARQLSRTDSQLFEDATELQQYFITVRNDLCKNGRSFTSPALRFTEEDLQGIVEEQRKEKQPVERNEDAVKPDDPRLSPSKKKDGDTELQSLKVNEITYTKGEFVYVKPNDDKLERHILRVERIWRDEGQRQEFISGNWYYRPYETYHLATRKFLEKEVFRTEFYDSVDALRLVGKCYVMFVKDYFKFRPSAFEDADVYVCESRYLGRIRHFKKIKYWHIDMDAEKVEFVQRTKPVSTDRVPSVFSNIQDSDLRQSDDHDEEEEDYSVLERKQEEIMLEPGKQTPNDGTVYYKKINFNDLWLKIGDGAYVKGKEGGKRELFQIDRLWRTTQGEAFLSGLAFVRPWDVIGIEPSRLCYRQELFATDRQETIPLSQIMGKFTILSVESYSSARLTEILEPDVFLCEYTLGPTSGSNELEGKNDSAPEIVNYSIPNIELSPSLDDEYYRFKKPLRLEKEAVQVILKEKTEAERVTVTNLADVTAEIDTSDWLLLKGLHTTPKLGARSKSGYILFSAVVRKKIMAENPDSSFGDISKIVGQEWKKLSDDDKKRYEEEAARIAQEREKADHAAGGRQALLPGQIRVYCCKWKECDYQFETSEQLYDHITTAHTSQIVDGENQYICLWLTCVKYRKDGKPFPSLPRLHRHIKDKHLPTSAKCMQPQNKSKHYVPLIPQPSSTPQTSPKPPDTPQPSTAPPPATPQSVQAATSTPQVVYYQQSATGQQSATRLLLDAQGNVLPGQQVVIYQVQQSQQTPASGSMSQTGQPPAVQTPAGTSTGQQESLSRGDPGRVVVQAPQKPVEPVFVAPPKQRVQRVLHSDVYLKYIQGLAANQPTNSRWDRTLQMNIPPPQFPARHLPSSMFHQLPETKEQLGVLLANLRNHIMKDTLGLKRIVDSTTAYL